MVLLALVLLLRSVTAPLVLVSTVVATYLASLGLSWWIFTEVMGFARLDDGVPLLAFLFLVALGVDYNIFLVSRAAEEARDHGARPGMLRALTATGGVITSAGILLAAVFAVLGVLPLVVLAQLGVVICVGVLLDTLGGADGAGPRHRPQDRTCVLVAPTDRGGGRRGADKQHNRPRVWSSTREVTELGARSGPVHTLRRDRK